MSKIGQFIIGNPDLMARLDSLETCNDSYLEDITEHECLSCTKRFHLSIYDQYDIPTDFCSIACKNNWVLSEYDIEAQEVVEDME